MLRKFFKFLAALLVLLILAVIGFGVLNYAPDLPVSALQKWSPPPSQFITLPSGLQVHVRDEGVRDDPTPIVLLHGTSASLHTWEGWVSALKDTRRVITFDLLGFGLTGPAVDGQYSHEAYAQQVLSVMDALAVPQAILGGNSFGGQVAWHVALKAPARVSKLILVDASGYPLTQTQLPLGFRLATMPVLNRFMDVILPRGVIEASVKNVYGDPSKVGEALIDRYYDLTRRAGNRAALVQRFVQAPPDGEGKISQIKQPTLILWGEKDRLIPPDHALRFQKDLAGSVLKTFPTLGHVPHEEDPTSTVAVAQAFLAGEGEVMTSSAAHRPAPHR
jgi:pimeloyl-ACP methyl ester carboxylesterase